MNYRKSMVVRGKKGTGLAGEPAVSLRRVGSCLELMKTIDSEMHLLLPPWNKMGLPLIDV